MKEDYMELKQKCYSLGHLWIRIIIMDFVSSSKSSYAFFITHWLIKGNSMYFCLLWSSLTRKQVLQLNFKDTGIFRGENMKSQSLQLPKFHLRRIPWQLDKLKWMNACNESIPQQTKSSSIIDLFAYSIWSIAFGIIC